MSTPLGSDIEARVTQVLQDFLPAELDLVDTQRGGTATPDVPNGNYLSGPRSMVTNYPGITVNLSRYSPVEIRPVSMDTGRLGYDAHVEIACHVQQETDEDVNRMRDLAERYLAGIVRVLFVKKDGLETSANNVRFAEIVLSDGDWTAVDGETQGSGARVRSIRIPIIVRMREAL